VKTICAFVPLPSVKLKVFLAITVGFAIAGKKNLGSTPLKLPGDRQKNVKDNVKDEKSFD